MTYRRLKFTTAFIYTSLTGLSMAWAGTSGRKSCVSCASDLPCGCYRRFGREAGFCLLQQMGYFLDGIATTTVF